MLCFGRVLSEYHKLSNFFHNEFEYNNIKSKSVKQGFQYIKTVLFGDNHTAHSKSLSESKHLSQQINKFDVAKWSQGRDSLMTAVVQAEFSQKCTV